MEGLGRNFDLPKDLHTSIATRDPRPRIELNQKLRFEKSSTKVGGWNSGVHLATVSVCLSYEFPVFRKKKKYNKIHGKTKLIIRSIKIHPKQESGGQCDNIRGLKICFTLET